LKAVFHVPVNGAAAEGGIEVVARCVVDDRIDEIVAGIAEAVEIDSG
jgi:hypothetical protein